MDAVAAIGMGMQGSLEEQLSRSAYCNPWGGVERGGEVSKGTVDGISQVTSIKIYMYVSLMYSINLF